MLIRPVDLARIRDGEIDLAFRRWSRPGCWSAPDAHLGRAGRGHLGRRGRRRHRGRRRARRGAAEQLLELMARKEPDPIWRVGLRYAGDDPRVALRNAGDLSAEERADLLARLDRFDRASRSGPWTRAVLRLIGPTPAAGHLTSRPSWVTRRAVQARRAQAQGAGADRVARGRLPPLAPRGRSARGHLTLAVPGAHGQAGPVTISRHHVLARVCVPLVGLALVATGCAGGSTDVEPTASRVAATRAAPVVMGYAQQGLATPAILTRDGDLSTRSASTASISPARPGWEAISRGRCAARAARPPGRPPGAAALQLQQPARRLRRAAGPPDADQRNASAGRGRACSHRAPPASPACRSTWSRCGRRTPADW